MIETDVSTFFTVNTSTVTRGHSFKLFVSRLRLDVRKYFSAIGLCAAGTVLPAQQSDFSSLNKFKHLLDRVDFSNF